MSLLKSILGMVAVLTAVHQLPAAMDLQRAPSPAMVQDLRQEGFAGAAGMVRDLILAQYVPGQSLSRGSSGRAEFRAWIELARWLELLARSDRDAAAVFFSRYLQFDGDGQPTLIHVGSQRRSGFHSTPVETVAGIVEGARDQLSSIYLPAGFQWRNAALADYLGEDLGWALAADPGFLSLFWDHVSDMDFLPGVLSNLAEIHAKDERAFDEYRALALALAVVFDQNPPKVWPHHQVEGDRVPLSEHSIVDRFDLWVSTNRSTRLAHDLRGLDPGYLRFVVDILVDPTELDWARRHVRHPVSDFGRAFSEIKYDRDRLAKNQFSWPHPGEYRLESIRKHGGICVDQAYFAMLSGKAHGLPTLYFVGQGADGGHAWFGYMRGANRWDMDVGRYENQNYAVGYALDPQSWEPISDTELAFLASRFRGTPDYAASRADLVVANWFVEAGDPDKARGAGASALAASRGNPDAWRALTRLLVLAQAPAREIDAHLESAAGEFASNRELLAEFSAWRAEQARDRGDAATADSIEKALISRTSRDRADLALETVSRRLEELLASGRTRDALREYQSQASRLGRSAGGNFFYHVTLPFAKALTAEGDERSALRAVHLARQYLRPESGSILDRELAQLEAAVQK